MDKIVTLVPYRPASDRHRWLWDCIQPQLASFGWPIFLGSCEGPWRRAAAVNDAATKAGSWDAAFIADCDTIPDPDGILRAVEWVRSTGGACRPHDQRYMLNQKQTITAVQRGVGSIPVKELKAPYAGGGLDVLTRDAWDAVGGMNAADYIGWGYEDSEFHVQLVVQSRWDRLPGHAWHLWHDHTGPANRESVQRFNRTVKENRAALDAWLATKGLTKGLQVF